MDLTHHDQCSRTEAMRIHHMYLQDCFYKILVCYINIHLYTLGGDIKCILTVDGSKKKKNTTATTTKNTQKKPLKAMIS